MTKVTLAKLDENNDGKLSFDEYIKLIEHLFTDLYNGTHPGAALINYSENLFRTMDSDGNGTICEGHLYALACLTACFDGI